MEMNYSLLENGLDFILDAAQKLSELNDSDLDDKDSQRLIKYALLHLSAGIELVFKYRLFKEHWTYVFADMNKANKQGLSSGDFSSVDSKTSIDRLKSLCDIAFDEQEKTDLQRLRNRRNRAEHFSLNEPLKAVEISMHKSISIITKFLVNHCNTDEFLEEETSLFEDIKGQLREMEQHHNDAKAIAERQLSDMNMTGLTITCPACGEKFLIRDDKATCVFCGYTASGTEAAQDYVENVLGIDSFSTIKDGGEIPVYECPQCGNDALVFNNDTGEVLCFSCDYEGKTEDFSFCDWCGKPYECDGDDEIGMCPDCIAYRMEKDD